MGNEVKSQKSKLFSLENKVIIITGGEGFLGKYYVKALEDYGAKVINFDIKSDPKVDITDKKSVDAAVKKVINNYGKIDVLINNAALKTDSFYDDFEKFPLEDWEKVMKVNLTAMFIMAQAVVPFMKKQKSGSIISVSSIYGVVGPDFNIYGKTGRTTPAVYSASKAGVLGFTRYLATYLGKNNIRVNSITPGGVFNNQEDEFVKNYSKKTPLGRMAEPNDLIGAMIFLASDDSSYMTGQNLIIDGGWTVL